MFSQVDLKETKFYQEVFTEGRQEERKILIQRLAARGVSAGEIAQIVDLALEEVEVTIAQTNQLP